MVRIVLTKLEELDSTQKALYPREIGGYSEELISYHFSLLYQAGLICASISPALNGPISGIATGLTWEGHEFLDNIRSNTAWSKIKKYISEKGLELSFESIKKAASLIISNVLS